MSTINICLDAMGGDYSIKSNIGGAVLAINEMSDLKITLVGKQNQILDELNNYTYDKNKIDIVNASEVIANDEIPTNAIKTKKDSSIVVGLELLKEESCDGFVSSGNTGAILTGATVIVGRIKGIERPALGAVLPSFYGNAFLIDCGANVDAKASHMVQFAKMGSAYMEVTMGVHKPKVALVNIGTERSKGNALTKEVYPLLEQSNLNFIGNVEARDIPIATADVFVCDAFVGNVILKHTEGMYSSLLKVFASKFISSESDKKTFVDLKYDLSYEKVGGTPFLGLKALVVKAHGSSNDIAIKNAVFQCYNSAKNNLTSKIAESVLELS